MADEKNIIKTLDTPESEVEAESESSDRALLLESTEENQDVSEIISKLSGQQKVAAILVAMGKDAASKLLQYFSKEDLHLLIGQAQALPNMRLEDFEILVNQFEDSFAKGVSLSEVGERFRQLIMDTLPSEQALEILNPQNKKITGLSIQRAMDGMTAEKIHAYIGSEHPQVIAYILSKLPQNISAELLLLQDIEMRANILHRQLRIKEITPATESLLESALLTIFTKNDGSSDSANYNQIASILNELNKSVIDETLEKLKVLTPEDIDSLKARIFIFEDIAKLSKKSCAILFNDMPIETTTLALRNTSEELKTIILDSLSPRSRRMVETELEAEDENITQIDIEKAHKTVAQAAIKLIERGAIQVQNETNDENSSI